MKDNYCNTQTISDLFSNYMEAIPETCNLDPSFTRGHSGETAHHYWPLSLISDWSGSKRHQHNGFSFLHWLASYVILSLSPYPSNRLYVELSRSFISSVLHTCSHMTLISHKLICFGHNMCCNNISKWCYDIFFHCVWCWGCAVKS